MAEKWICDRHLWRTNKGEIVEDGDPRAAFLMATPGMILETKPVIEKFEGEKAKKPSEDKALKASENKGKGNPKPGQDTLPTSESVDQDTEE